MAKTAADWASSAREKLKGAIVTRSDPFREVLRTPSPSINATFTHTHGLHFGGGLFLWGEPKQGKTRLLYHMIGALHRYDPTAVALRYDTEFRDLEQADDLAFASYGIDPDRYIVVCSNDPREIFEDFHRKVLPMLDAGMNLRMIAIDSVTGIQGRRTVDNGNDVMAYTPGDMAQTVGAGMKSILPIQKTRRIPLICTAHARAEWDPNKAMKRKIKPAGSFDIFHHLEFWGLVQRVDNKDGRQDALERPFERADRKDMMGHAERTAYKMRFTMTANSVGVDGRVGECTMTNDGRIVNVHEEYLQMGENWGIIGRPNNRTYEINGQTFSSFALALEGMKDPALQRYVFDRMLEKERAIEQAQAKGGEE